MGIEMNKLFDLSGKVAVVTGGNGGIGFGIAKGLAAAGASIAIVGRNQAKTLDAAAQLAFEYEIRSTGFVADISQPEHVGGVVESILSQFGRIDILVNNAGINIRKRPELLTLEEWNEVIRINLTGSFMMSKAVYPAMKQQKSGKIINIGSMTSIFGAAFAPAYAASKSGVVQLTKSLALAWAADGIQVNCILPGFIETDLTDKARVEVPEVYDKVVGRIAAGRWGRPEDLSGTAIWLASDASNYVTGVAVAVDGGYSSAV
jgi:2-deoxy-D-gluconate 3-dehydrogenase